MARSPERSGSRSRVDVPAMAGPHDHGSTPQHSLRFEITHWVYRLARTRRARFFLCAPDGGVLAHIARPARCAGSAVCGPVPAHPHAPTIGVGATWTWTAYLTRHVTNVAHQCLSMSRHRDIRHRRWPGRCKLWARAFCPRPFHRQALSRRVIGSTLCVSAAAHVAPLGHVLGESSWRLWRRVDARRQ